MRDAKALLVRPDPSKTYLNSFKSQGYVTVIFVSNMQADPDCAYLNGNVYDIEQLLTLDNPLFRMSHPNCNCKFEAYEKSTSAPTITPSGPAPQTTPTTPNTTTPTITPTTTTNETQVPEEKKPWYKKWMPWLFKNKQNSDFKARILRRAYDAKNRRESKSIR